MRKFFLDQFLIQAISQEKNGQLKLICKGNHDGSDFNFHLYMSSRELNALLESLKEAGQKIKKWLSKGFFTDMLRVFKKSVVVESCWLTIKVVELCEPLEYTDREYYVENFGFIPE
jgi:hypothetical protein